ncbi:MAG: oxidoreductase [Pirellulaceae bacterium]|nr:MAG: oxidoreductase [Pirellulaceae bacterium]
MEWEQGGLFVRETVPSLATSGSDGLSYNTPAFEAGPGDLRALSVCFPPLFPTYLERAMATRDKTLPATTPRYLHRRSSRRGFLQTSGTALLGIGVHTMTARARPRAANDKLQVACIGTANRAASDIEGVAGEAIVALCDVDRNYLDRKRMEFPDARPYGDYRELLDKEADRIDAVVIGTPDHHHAPATLLAIRAGKHVYCEKPLTHTVEEARMVTEASKAAGVATQLGTQIHSGDNYRRVVEILQSGAIGEVTDVHVWVGKAWGGGERPEQGEEPPEHLNWDLWLGPAPWRPFASGRYHPAQWRRWWDFGQGTLGDMGCHYMDLPFWALGLSYPTEIEAEGPEVHPETAPLGIVVRYRFPAAPGRGPVQLTWYDGNRIPRHIEGQPVKANGVMFVGSEGMMFADYTSYRLFPADKFANYQPPPPTIASSVGHHQEWLNACRDGTPTGCDFSYSGPLTEAVLLGNVAYRSGRKVRWNAAELRADHPDAQRFVTKSYREGWDFRHP